MEISELYKIWKSTQKISTDSRNIEKGCIFFALRGDNFNGNMYAHAALQAGAHSVVVDDLAFFDKEDNRYILVESVLIALQQLANFHRRKLSIPVLGITGSNGKTTTKELLRDVLLKKYKTFATKGNLNNHIGVPITLLSVDKDIEFLIVEMGANHQGEIDTLCKIAEPTFTMITNIGKAHLEGFGGVEGIKKGKSELYKYARANGGFIFINEDDQILESLIPSESKTINYSANNLIKIQSEDPAIVFEYNGQIVETNLYGTYNKPNIAFAIAAGNYFGVSENDICDAIGAYIPDNNRSQMEKKSSTTYIKDAYNANPTSMRLSLESFSKIKGRKIIVLGDMLELGIYAHDEHAQIIQLADALSFDEKIYIGKLFLEAGIGKDGIYFEKVEDARNYFSHCNKENAYVLLKGSRGIAVEKILS